MAIDYNRRPDARARAEGPGNAMAYIIGAVLIAGIIAMVAMFATDRTSTDTTPPAAAVNQPQRTTPPSNTTTTAPTQPSTK